jgi:predicted butyrate kinase (DUF1464 family)
MRVIGIDPGTVSLDVCGLDDGRVFLDQSVSTADALANPGVLIAALEGAAPLDLVAGPSGYGLPLANARDLTESDLRLAYLAAEGEAGGIGGLRSLMRALARLPVPVVVTPGVIHLPSVPAHRKVNRVDMGTADKVCAVALAIHQQMVARGCRARDVSLLLVELGGAFTAAIALQNGRIVDGVGGTSGPIGARSAGAWDGEVAFLAGSVTKTMLFAGGAASIGEPAEARQAYVEGVEKTVAMLSVAAPDARAIVLSGRHASSVHRELAGRSSMAGRTLSVLSGFAATAKEGAQGAAILADGLAGGRSAEIVDTLGIRDASGTVLDHLHVISPSDARRRIGLR